MNIIDAARRKILYLYRTHPDIHINVILDTDGTDV